MKNTTYSSMLSFSLEVSYFFLEEEYFSTSMLGRDCVKGSAKGLCQTDPAALKAESCN